MKIPLLIAFSGLVGAVIAAQAGSADTLLEKHTSELQSATGLTVQYTLQVLPGGGPQDYVLKLGKNGKFRLESPDETIVADGTTVWDYKKSDNSYTQAQQTDSDLKAFLKRDAVFPWVAFFVKEPFKDTTGIKVGSSRIMKGKAVTDVSMTLPGAPVRTASLFVDNTLGVARGGTIKSGEDGQTILMAKELTLSKDALADSTFSFAVPDGAKKVDPATAAVSFDKVAKIFNTNCIGCHGSGNPRSGLDLTSYQGVMTGGRGGAVITAGDPDNSRIMAYLKANGKPVMPPRGQLSDGDLQTIAGWIKAGAKQ
ncbi:MAG: c-type cytochrome [Fimbriimonas sp.]|nr:c-type cytochrome [Fimbriimonas sp.]